MLTPKSPCNVAAAAVVGEVVAAEAVEVVAVVAQLSFSAALVVAAGVTADKGVEVVEPDRLIYCRFQTSADSNWSNCSLRPLLFEIPIEVYVEKTVSFENMPRPTLCLTRHPADVYKIASLRTEMFLTTLRTMTEFLCGSQYSKILINNTGSLNYQRVFKLN